MASPKTVTPDQPQAVPDALRKLQIAAKLLQKPSLTPEERCFDALAMVNSALADLAARPVLPVETPVEGLREADFYVVHSVNGHHIATWTSRSAAEHCLREFPGRVITPVYTAPAPLSGRDGSLREALERAEAERDLALYALNHPDFAMAGLGHPSTGMAICTGLNLKALGAAKRLRDKGLVTITDSAAGPMIRWADGRGAALAAVPPETGFRCKRCGMSDHEAREAKCERGPCPMEQV